MCCVCAVWARHQVIWRVPKSGGGRKEGKRIREAISRSRAVSTDSTQQRGKDNEIGERANERGKGQQRSLILYSHSFESRLRCRERAAIPNWDSDSSARSLARSSPLSYASRVTRHHGRKASLSVRKSRRLRGPLFNFISAAVAGRTADALGVSRLPLRGAFQCSRSVPYPNN